MQIVVTDSNEFEGLIDALGNDLVAAAIHLRLHRDLRTSVTEYFREFNQANTFWQLTFNAHLQHGLQCLARAYDQQRHALSLRSWLETIQQNLHLFDTENFRHRLCFNPFVDSLAESARRPDLTTLDSDLAACGASDPLVNRLIKIRNNVLGHRSASFATQGANPYHEYPLTFEDIDALLDRGFAIYNRYNQLFRAVQHARQMVGHDDYLQVLNAVRRDLNVQEERFQEQLRRVT